MLLYGIIFLSLGLYSIFIKILLIITSRRAVDIKRFIYNIILIFILTISSVCIFALQYFIFHDPKDASFYLLQDLAFVPIQAIIVTLVLNKLIHVIEKENKLKKINVIISAFFSEAGTSILFAIAEHIENHSGFNEIIRISEHNKSNMKLIKKMVNEFNYEIIITPEKLDKLKAILTVKKSYMISMLENTNLLEHDSFTDMLWATFHVADELQTRENLRELTNSDITHLSTDILRAYKMIIIEWINYIKYLKKEYPFLYNLAIRKNPFNDNK